MKEFSAQTGGRYTYADDLQNLQDLALAFAQIFDTCDHFIISGCEVSGTSISAGYVYLNGKLRYFSGATGISSWPQYIYETNSTESVPYESGSAKNGRNIYSCALAQVVPTALDELTGNTPTFIPITEQGGLRMKDAFFGKYSLLLDPVNSSQTVKSAVNFNKTVEARGGLTATQPIIVKSGAYTTAFSYSDSNFVISTVGNENAYKIAIEDGNGIKFYINNVLAATIGETIVFSNPVSAQQGTFGALVLSQNHLFNGTSNSVDTMYLNWLGYNGGTSVYRNTVIGNGKGTAIVEVAGANSMVSVNGSLNVYSGNMDLVTLKSNRSKTNNELRSAILWTDNNNAALARVGFVSNSNQKFYINSSDSDIEVISANVVNIGPSISENGVLLSNKYALKASVEESLNLKADLSSVYSKSDANERFGLKGAGLDQFVSDSVTGANCCAQIGAASKSELSQYAKLTNYLSDMADTEEAKALIRNNIGAAAPGDFQAQLGDTGWILIKDTLYARQIGNIVCIQGSVKTIHSGTIFSIPNNIQAPSHAVKYTIAFDNSHSWVCKIVEGQRACVVVYCNSSCGKTTEFSITYMV